MRDGERGAVGGGGPGEGRTTRGVEVVYMNQVGGRGREGRGKGGSWGGGPGEGRTTRGVEVVYMNQLGGRGREGRGKGGSWGGGVQERGARLGEWRWCI